VSLAVSDLDRSVVFYTQILSFKRVSQSMFQDMKVARLQLGDEFIDLRQYSSRKGRAPQADYRSNDRYFQHVAIIVSDMDQAYAVLQKNKVRSVSSGPQRLPDWNKNAGGIKAFYFKDPDGHPLEILQFPPDKGDPKWQQKKRLFLGIDHTAIVVGSTEKSLAFYRDRLGFAVKGESINYGIEQERLNNVGGARLHITGLRAGQGPGIEFLEYITPKDGRPYPEDALPDDLIFTETVLVSESPTADCNQATIDCLLRDPDGHAVMITEGSHAEK